MTIFNWTEEFTRLGKFTKINESFQCINCSFEVPPATRTCRNHCPKCLHSVHIDVYPGDRANKCHGLLRPVAYDPSRKGLSILFECQKCSEKLWNIAILDDEIEPDDYATILNLGAAYWSAYLPFQKICLSRTKCLTKHLLNPNVRLLAGLGFVQNRSNTLSLISVMEVGGKSGLHRA